MKTFKKTFLFLAPVVVAVLPAAPALAAGDKAACLDASSKAQTLRDAHDLVGAREQLRLCAAARCPSVVQSDCATWLTEVEKALPSVVLAAKDGAGADISDVTVTMDGQPIASSLDGQSLTTNPGPHTFHFQRADGTSFDRRVIVKEGEKNQVVAGVLGAPPVAPPPSPPASEGAGASGGPSPAGEGSSGTLSTVGWVLGGVGIVGLGIGAVFGVEALSTKSSNCSNGLCTPGSASTAYGQATISTVGFIAGGILVAGGLALVIAAPSGGGEKHAASLAVAPLVGSSVGGLQLAGRW